ncbi:MAG: glycosyltransferase [Candidatus Micrarchaeia archaeon]
MDKIKVAFYTDTYLPAIDGVVTSMLNFKRELENRGHEVYIFASGDADSKKVYSNSHVFIMQGIKFKPYPQYKLAFFPYHTILKLQAENIDVVHAQTPFFMGFTALTISKLMKYPIIGSFHTLVNNSKVLDEYYPKNKTLKKFTSKYLWSYTKFFYRKCDKAIVPTKTIEELLAKQGMKNIEVVPNSVDMKRFNTKINGDTIRDKLGLKDNERVVLYVGRISKEKRIEVMLKAAKVLSKKRDNVKFVIVGTGPAMKYYMTLANKLKLGDKVKFAGFASEGALPKYYAMSDLLCMPSTFETQGIVALEAMASGKPVVGSDYLALKEMIKNNYNGEKFKAGDYLQCASKIEKVLNNSSVYKRNAVAFASGFSVPKVTDRLLEVYNKILNDYKAIY